MQKPLELPLKKQLVNPLIVQAPFATRDIATNNKQIEIIQNTDTGITNPNSTPRNGIENTSPIEYGNTVGTAAILDKLPEFPADISNFYTYIDKTFETSAINEERSSRIYVSFVVKKRQQHV